MKKQKASRGTGTWALYLGFLSILWLSSMNGVPVIETLGNKIGFHDQKILTLAVLILTVPGILLGLNHLKDWGAKIGTLLCLGTTINVVITIITSFYK
ncbi:hypothetical protein [Paenibacillus sp. NPDC057934]|uniref:hypothetical protein n=1 Tax=Paenibacillus sp. NPDC057934 TaxID=3346282 RepID=UPI0036DD39C0